MLLHKKFEERTGLKRETCENNFFGKGTPALDAFPNLSYNEAEYVVNTEQMQNSTSGWITHD